MLTDGWLTPAELSPEPAADARVPFVPGFVAIPDERAAGATAELEVRIGHRRTKHDRTRAVITARAPKVPEETELTPEEIVRRKLAYEEYLQDHGYRPIGDVLKQMRSEGANPDTSGARGKANDRAPKTDAPGP